MNRIAGLSLLTACLSILWGCETTETITRRSQLAGYDQAHPLRVFTYDSTSYVLKTYLLTDSVVSGTGYREQGEAHVPFSGSLPLSAVFSMQIVKDNVFKTMLAGAAVGFVGYTAASYIGGDETGIAVEHGVGYYNPHYSSPGGGGGGSSCPFIYSWNTDRYALDGEAYAVAWGKALEMTTCTLLPSVRPECGVVKVRIANERPETHYTNSVRLRAAQVDVQAYAAPDNQHRLWSIAEPVAPLRAQDNTGRDITGAINRVDNVFWESNFSDIPPASEFRDVIDLTFPNMSHRDSGTVLIRAVNSDIFDVVLRKVSTVVGSEVFEFIHALETDTELIALMREWTDDSSLKVHIWNGHAWELSETIKPEANVTPFSKAIRIKCSGATADSVRIRLSCLADVWKIDAVQLDWTPAQPLEAVEIPLLTALGPGNRDVARSLSDDDEAYVTSIPPEKIDLSYRAVDPLPEKRVVYMLEVRGYLYEWMNGYRPGMSTTVFAGGSGSGRVSLLKSLLRSRSLILPPIYAEWIAAKGRIPTLK